MAALLCILMLVWRCHLVFSLDAPEMQTAFASDTRIDSIVYGCILAFLMRRSQIDVADSAPMSAREYAIFIASCLVLFATSSSETSNSGRRALFAASDRGQFCHLCFVRRCGRSLC